MTLPSVGTEFERLMNHDAGDKMSTESLQQELQTKNEVIAALTDQLEGTADQLDRLQRSGVRNNERESSGRPGIGLTGQVEAALEYIDELDPAAHFERLESGIDQLLEMLSGRSITELSEQNETDTTGAATENDFWNATKERLLESEENSAAEEYSDSSTLEPDTDCGDEHQPASRATRVTPPPPLAEPPKPIEDIQDPVALEEGVTERDSYIVSLIARLRVVEEAQYAPLNWEELADAPEELKASLISLKKQLKDNLLRADVSVSLERASLTRERSKLFHVKRQLEQEVKRIGLTSIVDSQTQDGEQVSNSRWAKFFDTE